MSNIIDILINKCSPYNFVQTFIVLDKMPELKFERKGSLLVATDGIFYSAYALDLPSGRGAKAFAGREFEIPLINGGVEHAKGQWWQCLHPDVEGIELVSHGISSLKDLAKCYVFYGGYQMDKRFVDAWLEQNTPSEEYRKYDRHTNYL